ncbi:BatD family protein [Methylococcus geothermalis]|uniref:Protein BatD n=1 Tax=Methylococcus geothermalis TaxID=2681310 RepID=A0A858Q4Y0_9GAMM|nr:BatD family protein [Methylococcus geothermalis]QJD28902.1 protein BatD [Methylococcus geothermalis]
MAKRRRQAWRLMILGLLLYLGLSGTGMAVEITVTADRDPVPIDESFNLTFSADESPDDEPDFTPLNRDFRVLGQSRNSQISMVDGKLSRTLEWTVSVIAKHAGTLTVPSIAFGADRSKSATVTVTDRAVQGQARSGGDDALLIEVDVAPENPYVQAQAIYTVRVLYRTNLGRARLSPLEVPDALVQQLGDKRNFSTERHGNTYAATEIRYAIFPQKSGTLRIPPLTLDAEVQAGGRGGMIPFFGRPAKTVSLQSEPVELQVRPAPAAFSGKHWLPAESVTLEETLSPDTAEVEAGQPLTRTLTLKARGATVGVLPELSSAGLPAEIRSYPDQPALDEQRQGSGLFSTRQEKTALIPDKPGRYALPAIEVPWWNIATEKMEVARLPERVIEVGAGAARRVQPVPTAVPSMPAEPGSTAPASVHPEAAEPAMAASPVWFWLSIVLAVGWLITAGLWWRSTLRAHEEPAKKTPENGRPSDRQCMRELKEACAANDPERTRRALLDWAALRWPDHEASLEGIASHSEGELKTAVQALGRALYGHPREAWKGELLWAAIVTTDLGKARQENRGLPELASLHPAAKATP